jgi:hypothetical protein
MIKAALLRRTMSPPHCHSPCVGVPGQASPSMGQSSVKVGTIFEDSAIGLVKARSSASLFGRGIALDPDRLPSSKLDHWATPGYSLPRLRVHECVLASKPAGTAGLFTDKMMDS